MEMELLLKHFETHPFLVTFLILASMFFLSIWWRGWPTINEDNDTDDFLDEDEEKKFSITWEQTTINTNERGLPTSIEGTFTIKKEKE